MTVDFEYPDAILNWEGIRGDRIELVQSNWKGEYNHRPTRILGKENVNFRRSFDTPLQVEGLNGRKYGIVAVNYTIDDLGGMWTIARTSYGPGIVLLWRGHLDLRQINSMSGLQFS